MESLFKLTELESRISLNMNVLSKGKVPKVMDLAEVLKEWLEHRRDVLVRRSKHRLAQIDHRLEVLGGFLVAYLNLDKVIKIIRNEDEPKPVLIKAFKLSDVQADAILNMRLRNLRKLEEMEIKTENKALREEKTAVEKLIRSEKEQWKTVADQVKKVANIRQENQARRSAAPPSPRRPSTTRPPSKRPWWCASRSPSWCRRRAGSARCAAIRPTSPGLRSRPTTGRSSPFRRRPRRRSGVRDQRPLLHHRLRRSCRAAAATASRCGLYADMEQDVELVSAVPLSERPQVPGGEQDRARLRGGRGRCLANTRKGKQVLNVKPPDAARAIAVVDGEMAAAVGENRKMVIFALDQVPEMARGRGVRLQRHKDGGLST
jgi:topoisomerase-4 subunit A